MIDADQIPDEVVEAAAVSSYATYCATVYPDVDCIPWDEIDEEFREEHRAIARASIAAALNAWPGMGVRPHTVTTFASCIILPLPQEVSDE